MRRTLGKALGVLAVCMVTAAAGCAASPSSQPNAGANNGGTNDALTVALNEPPASLDPLGATSAAIPTLEVGLQVFDTLVKQGSKAGAFVPDLATSWSHPSADEWRFNLRTDAVFANGDPVTSHDVAASLEALVASKSPGSDLWAQFKSATTPNSHTVVINTSSQMGTILYALTLLDIAPASEVNNTAFWNKPYGSGPFMVSKFVPDESVTLVPNPHYWGSPAKLKTLTMISVPNESDLTAYLKSGEVDVALSVPPDQAPALSGTPNLNISVSPSYEYDFLWFNASRKPFNNALVRQAMWYALPLSEIVKSVWGKYATLGTAPIPSSVFGYHAETPYSYNPTLAKQLLAKAGYPNGFSTSMMWEANQSPYLQTMASLFTSAWSAVGINVTMDQEDPATWLNNLLALNWNMDFQEAGDLTGDADYILGRLYLSSADRNGYKNPTLDTLLTQARESVNSAQQAQLYAQAINLIWSQADGIYPLQVNLITAANTRVVNFVPAPSSLVSFADVSVK
jgi:peptide/nickel transport system substrate-binding protein